MNVRLQYDIEFLAGIYYDNQLQMNSYSASLSLVTRTKDTKSTNVAMDRLKAFVYGELESTIFINQNYHEHAEMMQIMGANVTTLPEEPVDQIVGMMLYYKLNAIMEGRMEIVQLDISSRLGDGVWYMHSEDDLSGPFAQDGWWHQSSLQHNTLDPVDADMNVVKVVPNAWMEYGLIWPETETVQVNQTANTVVFANFSKHED
jgi:hypothetical protein